MKAVRNAWPCHGERPKQHHEGHAKRPDHTGEVFDVDRPHAALFPVTQNRKVFADHLNTAHRPARTLFPQTAQRFRHQNPAQRTRLVANFPVRGLQLPADVDVLSHHLGAPVADPMHC